VTTAAPSRRFTGDFRADVLVVAVVVVALTVAFFYQRSLTNQTTTFKDDHSGLTLAIPNNWTVNKDGPEDTFVSAYDTRADSIYKSTINGRSFALDADNPSNLDTLVDGLVQEHQTNLLAFHLLDIQPTTVGGAD
jgi:hypothetical protein